MPVLNNDVHRIAARNLAQFLRDLPGAAEAQACASQQQDRSAKMMLRAEYAFHDSASVGVALNGG
jgi:hypothetical protein